MFLSRTITAPTLARVQVDRSATWRVMVRRYWCQLGRSLMQGLHLGGDAERLTDEGEDEDDEGGDRRQTASRAERQRVIGRGRMAEGEERRDDGRPRDPAGPAVPAEPE